MAVPRAAVEAVLARTDIVELIGRTVTLRRNGRSFVGLCPFHQEKTPSFNVIPHKGIYHCFGCGEGGDAIAFLRKTRGLSFVEAVKELAQGTGIVIEDRELTPEERDRLNRKNDLYSTCAIAASWFHTVLMTAPEGAPGRAYLEQRGISHETALKYRLGYAPEGWTRLADHLHRQGVPTELALKAGVLKHSDRADRVYDVFRERLIFPILDERDRPIAFGGRILPQAADPPGQPKPPKYLNSCESLIYEKSKALYGLSWARAAAQRKDRLIVVEGYFDAVSVWQAGFEEAVATCGTALTAKHLETIARLTRKVVALFDTDEAGLRAATKSMELFLAADVSATRLDLGDAKDPDEFVQRHGAAAFEARLARGEPLVELVVRRTIQREGTDAGARARALDALVPVLRRLPPRVRGSVVLDVAGRLNLREAEVAARVDAPDEAAPAPTPTRWLPEKDLAHLLWLTLHYPEQVGPVLAEADPDLLSNRVEVLRLFHALALREPLPAVLARMPEDVARATRAIAARDAGYTEDIAAAAARAILARLELRQVEAAIRALNANLPSCTNPEDKSSSVKRLQALHQRAVTLKAIISRRAGRDGEPTRRA